MNSTVDYEILGHAVPSGAPAWETYLNHYIHPKRADLRLFPQVITELTPKYLRKYGMANRLRWVARFLQVHPSELYGAWLNDNLIVEESRFLQELQVEDFQAESRTFGIHMLRSEVGMASYYTQLRDALSQIINAENAPKFSETFLVLGPTAGGEIEAIHAAGGVALACLGEGEHVRMCEERLLHSLVPFETITWDELDQKLRTAKYIILTPYVARPKWTAQLAYSMLQLYGLVICPATSIIPIEEFTLLDALRCDSSALLATFFKQFDTQITDDS